MKHRLLFRKNTNYIEKNTDNLLK